MVSLEKFVFVIFLSTIVANPVASQGLEPSFSMIPQLQSNELFKNTMPRHTWLDPDSDEGTSQSSSVTQINSNYTSIKSRTRTNLAQFVSKTRAVDPAGAAKMETLFASTDIIAEIGKGIAPMGLRTNNVADAYAVYWMTAWQAANGDTSDFTREQSQAVKQQASAALSSTPQFAKAGDALKQEMAEAYLVQAALIQSVVDVGKTDPAVQSGVAAAVKKGAKASGLDLDAMTLTSEGFRPKGKKRGDASDTGADVPGAVPSSQLAANSAAPAGAKGESWSAGTVALIAAAGGIGAAGVFAMGKASGGKKG